jgi:acyl dehydratase
VTAVATRPAPGDRLPDLEIGPISRIQVAYMTVAMRDPNPVHVDDDFARQAGLPGAIAHGTFAVSALGTAVSRHVGVDALRRLKVELTAPVFPGDRLTTEVTVDDVEDAEVGGVVHARLVARNQAGATVARGRASWALA